MTKIRKVSPDNPEGITRDMTPEEQASYDRDVANAQARATEYAEAKAQKEADQASGNQKFLDMGLTQAEATALTGYTPPNEDAVEEPA